MKRIWVSIMWIIIGSVLIGLSFVGKVNEYWNSMGVALLVVGTLQILRFWKLNSDKVYREKMEIEERDERNHFIRGKAWAWAGYLFIIISAVLSIIFRIIHQDLLSLAASYAVCLVLVLYWVSYYLLRRKY